MLGLGQDAELLRDHLLWRGQVGFARVGVTVPKGGLREELRAWDKLTQGPKRLARLGYRVRLYGKVDIGAALMNEAAANISATGFHGPGPVIDITTRAADIRRPTKREPLSMTSDTNNKVHPEDWKTVERCREWIKQLPPAGQNDAPFFLHCSLNIPHPAFQTNATWLAKVNEDKIVVPQWPAGFPESWHPYDSYMSVSKHVQETSYTDQDILKVRKTYYAMCAEADYLLNQVWESLKDKGYNLSNTYLMYVSDHGEMNMEHRQDWKNSMYEASSRVPFAIAGPGVAKGRRVRQLTSLVDVFPTLLDMAGEVDWSRHSELAGKSVLPLANAPSLAPPWMAVTAGEDRAVVSQYHSNMGNTGSFMVRKGQWKYISFGHTLSAFSPDTYTPQLFDVDEDPGELRNLASQQQQVVEELHQELKKLFDPEEVDRQAKHEDYQVWQRFFVPLGKKNIMRKLKRTYKGFDQEDYKKLRQWLREASQIFDPAVVVV